MKLILADNNGKVITEWKVAIDFSKDEEIFCINAPFVMGGVIVRRIQKAQEEGYE